jgi:hypothetical protein
MGNKASVVANADLTEPLLKPSEVSLDMGVVVHPETVLTVGAIFNSLLYKSPNGILSQSEWDASQFAPKTMKVKDIDFDGDRIGWKVYGMAKTTTVRYGKLKTDVYARILGKNWLFHKGTKVTASLEPDGTALATLSEPVEYSGIMPTMGGGRRRKQKSSKRRKNLQTRRRRKHKQ